MIGTVTWQTGIVKNVATLHDDRTWSVTQSAGDETIDDPQMADFLALKYRDHYQGPSDGPYGARILNDLAAWKGGEARFEPKKSAPPGTVY